MFILSLIIFFGGVGVGILYNTERRLWKIIVISIFWFIMGGLWAYATNPT